MAIITISRELAALGDETAHELSEQLKYRFVDKQALEERIKSYGVAGSKFLKYDEKKPSFWASLSQDRDDYLHFLKSAIFAEAGEGSTVFIGRGAAMILKNVPGVFSVFLVAPPEIRIERIKSYFHCDDRRARQIMEQSDRDREGFHRYFYDVKWQDADNYHLALNTGHLHPAVCAEIVKYLRDRVVTDDTEAQSAQRIRELTLGQQIKNLVLYERNVPIHFLETSVTSDSVTLYGVANSQAMIEAAIAGAAELAGGFSIQSEIQVVHEYSLMH